MKQLAFSTDVEFANALLSDSETKARRLAANGNASGVQAALEGVRSAAKAAAAATDPGQALAAARDALVQSQTFAAAVASAARQQSVTERADIELAKAAKAAATAKAQRTTVTTIAPVATAASTAAGSAAKIRQLQSIVDDGRAMASQVIRKGTPENVQLARGYDRYLTTLRDSSRGVRSDRDADRMIGQAKQTRAYLQYLVKQTAASR
jgi:non-specific serine/threonine protein kinase